jgi:glycosyltransferase involved in cell wall biosynthesis
MLTVVMPNYNYGRYLPDSLGSIAAQERPADEVLIIDDGSSDESPQILDRFAEQYPSWRVIRHRERRGMIARLNEILPETNGDWIAFLAADDGFLPGFLARVSKYAIERPGAGLVCACAVLVKGTAPLSRRPLFLPRSEPGYVSPEEFRALLRTMDNFFVGNVTLYRRAALLSLGGFDPALGSMADSLLARRLAARFGFVFVPEVLGYWRIHGENYSLATAFDPSKIDHLLAYTREVLQAEPPGIFPANYADILERRLRFGTARLLALDRFAPSPARAAKVVEILKAGRAERKTLRMITSFGGVGAYLLQAWLFVRLRPFSLMRLALEACRALLKPRRGFTIPDLSPSRSSHSATSSGL